jgi:hypothetical protein
MLPRLAELQRKAQELTQEVNQLQWSIDNTWYSALIAELDKVQKMITYILDFLDEDNSHWF